MRSQQEVDTVLALVAGRVNDCEISRRTGIPRSTVKDWRVGKLPRGPGTRNSFERRGDHCPICAGRLETLNGPAYAYLLGQYLGDGCLSEHARGVFRLRIVSDIRHPNIIQECMDAMAAVMPRNRVGRLERHLPEYPNGGCVEIGSYSKHWPCLFPQYGVGRKHERPIRLSEWQQQIVDVYPERLIRGLIHSDGCRHQNPIRAPKTGKLYSYLRYSFSNRSEDIRGIFCAVCDRLGIHWTMANRWAISVARKRDVARLDKIVGPKS